MTPCNPKLCLWLHKHCTSLDVLDLQAHLHRHNLRMLYQLHAADNTQYQTQNRAFVSKTHKACFCVAWISSPTHLLVILLLTFYEAVSIETSCGLNGPEFGF